MRASFVSQETSFALLGVPGRQFLEVLVPRCRGVVRIGRTVLVELDEAERALRALGNIDCAQEAGETKTDDGERQRRSVDEVLASVGVRRRT
jgi:hypothetical protein